MFDPPPGPPGPSVAHSSKNHGAIARRETLTGLCTYQPPPKGLRYLIQRALGQLVNSANVDLEKISRVQDRQIDLLTS